MLSRDSSERIFPSALARERRLFEASVALFSTAIDNSSICTSSPIAFTSLCGIETLSALVLIHFNHQHYFLLFLILRRSMEFINFCLTANIKRLSWICETLVETARDSFLHIDSGHKCLKVNHIPLISGHIVVLFQKRLHAARVEPPEYFGR